MELQAWFPSAKMCLRLKNTGPAPWETKISTADKGRTQDYARDSKFQTSQTFFFKASYFLYLFWYLFAFTETYLGATKWRNTSSLFKYLKSSENKAVRQSALAGPHADGSPHLPGSQPPLPQLLRSTLTPLCTLPALAQLFLIGLACPMVSFMSGETQFLVDWQVPDQ